jgi:hypothetical protein
MIAVATGTTNLNRWQGPVLSLSFFLSMFYSDTFATKFTTLNFLCHLEWPL